MSRLLDSFVALYDDLLRQLLRRTGSRERAEDVAQETYLRLIEVESRGQAAEVRDQSAFIHRVAGNLAIDVARRHARRAGDGEPADSVSDPSPGPEQCAVAQDQLRQLDAAMRELPPDARLALLLFRVDGLSHAQIAERLGVSTSMVAKHLARALRHCRDRLQEG